MRNWGIKWLAPGHPGSLEQSRELYPDLLRGLSSLLIIKVAPQCPNREQGPIMAESVHMQTKRQFLPRRAYTLIREDKEWKREVLPLSYR